MHSIYWLAAILSLTLTGCVGTNIVSTLEARNELAPTGKLRIGFNPGSPLHATKDAASEELKGVAVDLGRELARRIGVPFEPVTYSSPSALIAGAQKGDWTSP